jgi:fluoride exporter
MLEFLAIPLGAIAGANARYWLSRFAVREWGPSFPYGTLTINLLRSLVVGFFMIGATEGVLADPRSSPPVVVGFCGAFTTFQLCLRNHVARTVGSGLGQRFR